MTGCNGRCTAIFTQVRERHEVPGLLEVLTHVRDPHLDALDQHTTIHRGKRPQGLVVAVAEVVAQEIVLVGLVLIRLDVEHGGLRTTLGLHVAPLPFLLAEDGRGGEPSETQFGLQAEEALAPLDQGAAQGKTDVAGLDLLDDLVLVTRVVQLHLVLEVEGGLRVVVGVDLQLLTDITHQVQLDPLVEVEGGDAPLIDGDPRILRLADVHPEDDLGRSPGFDVDGITPEDPVEGLATHLDRGDQRLLRALAVLLHTVQPVVVHAALHVVVEVLLQRHAHGRPVIEGAAYGTAHDVLPAFGVVDHFVLDVPWILQVDATRARGSRCERVGDRELQVHR